MEVRLGDATANPYLIIAATAAAAYLGIRDKADLPAPLEGYGYDPEVAPKLPQTLPAALGLAVTLRVVGLTPSWITITIGHLLWTLPFAAVVSLIGLSTVKPSTIAAARDLGASPIRAFVDITLPLMRANLISSFVFAFLLSQHPNRKTSHN